jgi:hypothetical protein
VNEVAHFKRIYNDSLDIYQSKIGVIVYKHTSKVTRYIAHAAS